MKRKLAGSLVIILLLSVALVYILIPRELIISSIVPVHCNAEGAFRVLGEESYWTNGLRLTGRQGAPYNLRIRGKVFHAMEISVERGDDSLLSSFTLLNLGRIDSTGLQWKCSYPSSLNPLRRVQQYRRSVALKQFMDSSLSRMRLFLEKKENVYGMPVQDAMSKDVSLLVTKFQTASYPSVPEIYRSVQAIRTYIASQGAREVNYPMLHVSEDKGKGFESMVGISVDRELNGNALIVPKRYVPWKIVVGEVRGGPYTAENAMNGLQQYISDFHLMPMGLPFQSLVTERDREPDTTRWVTRVVQAVP